MRILSVNNAQLKPHNPIVARVRFNCTKLFKKIIIIKRICARTNQSHSQITVMCASATRTTIHVHLHCIRSRKLKLACFVTHNKIKLRTIEWQECNNQSNGDEWTEKNNTKLCGVWQIPCAIHSYSTYEIIFLFCFFIPSVVFTSYCLAPDSCHLCQSIVHATSSSANRLTWTF